MEISFILYHILFSLKKINMLYALNMTLPVGTGVKLSAKQTVKTVTASCKGISVSGKSYGTVSVSAATYNRQHTGGSN